jgi:drug/metabolite transporter (DMT)-like permease
MPPLPYLQLQVQLHGIVFLFAATAFLGHVISLSAPAVVIWRTALAAIGAAAVVLVGQRATLFPPRRTIVALLAIGAIAGIHWLCFFGAIRLANVSICLAGMATTSLFTAFTEPWLIGRRIHKKEVLLGILVAVGLALIAGVETKHHLGLGLAICGAALAAVFPVMNRKFVLAGVAPETLLIWEMPGACLTALLFHPLFASYDSLWQWQGLDWLWMFFMAVVCTVFGHAFHSHLLRHITAYASNLAMNFEPVHGILLGALLFQDYQSLRPTFYLGAATIILANFLQLRKKETAG